MSRPCHVVRVFTRGDRGGNHLGVVLESEGLDTESMQAIAAGLGFSETVFFMPGEPPSVRIFTPGREMPFAGHPLVGITWLLHRRGVQTDRLLCGVGPVTIGYEDDRAWVEPPAGQPVRPAPRAAQVAATLGLPAPVSGAWVDMPIPYLVLELETSEAVAAASFDDATLATTGVGELYLYAPIPEGRVKARFFAPEAGVFEDPATGSAAVALAAKLGADGLRTGRLAIDQGDEMGHPSTIELNWHPQGVRIGGAVRYEEERALAR